GVRPGLFLGSRLCSKGGGSRTKDQKAGALRAAIHGRPEWSSPTGGSRGAAQKSDRGGSPGRRGKLLYDEDGGRSRHFCLHHALTALMVKTQSRRAHSPARRRHHGSLLVADPAPVIYHPPHARNARQE